MLRRRFFAAGVSALLLHAACSGVGPPLPDLPPPEAAPEADDLRDAIRMSAGAERDTFLVGRLRRGGLTPAFGGRFRLASGAVVAFVPGRHPARGRELVVAAAEGGTPGAAALLEEARLMSAHAAYAAVPERTVLVAFLPPRSGAGGLAAVLDAPVWTRPLTTAALVVGAEGTGETYEAVAGARGVPVRLLRSPPEARGDVATALALARVLREALDVAANGALDSD